MAAQRHSRQPGSDARGEPGGPVTGAARAQAGFQACGIGLERITTITPTRLQYRGGCQKPGLYSGADAFSALGIGQAGGVADQYA